MSRRANRWRGKRSPAYQRAVARERYETNACRHAWKSFFDKGGRPWRYCEKCGYLARHNLRPMGKEGVS